MMERVILQLVWIAAILGHRRHRGPDRAAVWGWILDLEHELGHPPFPYTGPAR